MTWLRLDDKFARHPKIEALTDAQFRVWVRVLCYCAEYQNRGRFEAKSLRILRGITTKRLENFVKLGLLTEEENGWFHVHDFDFYNPRDPTARERSRRYRDRNKSRDDGRDDDRDTTVAETFPRARAGAGVPSRPVTPLGGGRTDDPRTPAPAATAPNGPPLAALESYAHRFWDEYPDHDILRDELVDRGATPDQAARIIQTEERIRA